MRWYEHDGVLDYIISCYAGTDRDPESRKIKRQFIWENDVGELLIGNTRAFADHVRAKFGLRERLTAWMDIHQALRELGEQLEQHAKHGERRGKKFRNQEPEVRVLKRRD